VCRGRHRPREPAGGGRDTADRRQDLRSGPRRRCSLPGLDARVPGRPSRPRYLLPWRPCGPGRLAPVPSLPGGPWLAGRAGASATHQAPIVHDPKCPRRLHAARTFPSVGGVGQSGHLRAGGAWAKTAAPRRGSRAGPGARGRAISPPFFCHKTRSTHGAPCGAPGPRVAQSQLDRRIQFMSLSTVRRSPRL
jgi:hypothetical protein